MQPRIMWIPYPRFWELCYVFSIYSDYDAKGSVRIVIILAKVYIKFLSREWKSCPRFSAKSSFYFRQSYPDFAWILPRIVQNYRLEFCLNPDYKSVEFFLTNFTYNLHMLKFDRNQLFCLSSSGTWAFTLHALKR